MRVGIYLAGIFGYFLCALGNLWTASPEQIPLPFNMGYSLNHYLCSMALFVFFKTAFEQNQQFLKPLSKPLAYLSDLTFGVYWVHVLVLDILSEMFGTTMSLIHLLSIQVLLTLSISFLFAATIARIPILKRLLI